MEGGGWCVAAQQAMRPAEGSGPMMKHKPGRTKCTIESIPRGCLPVKVTTTVRIAYRMLNGGGAKMQVPVCPEYLGLDRAALKLIGSLARLSII